MYLLVSLLINLGLIIEVEQVLGGSNVVRLILLLEFVVVNRRKAACLLHESLQVTVEENFLELRCLV